MRSNKSFSIIFLVVLMHENSRNLIHRDQQKISRNLEMVSKPTLKPKPFPIFFISILLSILVITMWFWPNPYENYADQYSTKRDIFESVTRPKWYEIVAEDHKYKGLKIGTVNIDRKVNIFDELHEGLYVKEVKFQPVAQNIKWSDLFPVWINEEYPELQTCPEIPMPQFEEFQDLNVVVATVPCPGMATKLGFIDIFRLQVNLVVANLLVKSNKSIVDFSGDVYAVFLGSCGPMDEIFRCEDLLWHDNDIWVYKPDLRKLKQKMRMPVGTCQLARPIEEAAQVGWNKNASNSILQQPREAYVTVLHSSEDYLCGAIVLGQSIINSKSKKDMILLADSSISSESSKALRHAGWKIKRIERIKSPNAGKNAYNKYNYSKLRIWLLTEYDKVMFIDSDMLVFQNLDEFFLYPQLSAAENNRHIFNSGVMLIEPSRCTFETMMEKRFTIVSYNGGDQGFLNEIFRWWHRWPNKANFLKDFSNIDCGPDHLYPKNTHAMHYLGVKPWMCYRDYDCNWDIEDNQRFASDSAHAKWWQVFDSMPNKLKPVCVLTPDMEERAVIFRRIAKDGNYSDGHWKIKVKDPRRKMNDIP